MNCEQLTEELADVFRQLKSGKMKPQVALEINRTAGAIQANVRLQLFNARLRGDTPNIKFFATGAAEKPNA